MAFSKRIVLHAYGSLGDIHPYIALARGLADRGHRPVLATLASYRDKIQSQGLEFHAVGPELPDWIHRRVFHPYWGGFFLLADLLGPGVNIMYRDLVAACQGADMLVATELSLAAPMVVKRLGLPWVATAFSPCSFLSREEPDIPILPIMAYLSWREGRFFMPTLEAMKTAPRAYGNAMFNLQPGPRLVLAMFHPTLGPRRSDWPLQTVQTGFVYHDGGGEKADLPGDLKTFLDQGPPPVVFTLGSIAVWVAGGEFFSRAAQVAESLGQRAILVISSRHKPPQPLPPGIFVCPYAPFDQLFPRASLVAHHAGIGTTARCVRLGLPALAIPGFADQPDNSERLGKLGVARVLPYHECTAPRLREELGILLSDPSYRSRAAIVAQTMKGENGLAEACSALERIFENQ